MALLTETVVQIDGEKLLNFTSYQLVQSVGDHHTFTLRCARDTFERFTTNLLENARNLLGKTLNFKTSSNRAFGPAHTLEFSGLITRLVKERGPVDSRQIVITAHSPTVMLDGGGHYASYADLPLADIVKDLLKDCNPTLLPAQISPAYTETIGYSVQTRSHWGYLCRLAAQYGEWLYYDGSRLIFGTPPGGEELTLKQSQGLISHAITLCPQPNRSAFFAADYDQSDSLQAQGFDKLPVTNGLLSLADAVSEEIYPTRPAALVRRAAHESQAHELELQAVAAAKVATQESVRLQVSSSNPGVYPGRLVYIEDNGFNEGAFRVTRVVHRGAYTGNYENEFEGVSEQLDVYPLTSLAAYPRSNSQVAFVVETDDPAGLGRVRVQFAWQVELDQVTPWVRVAAAHAGPDKGIYFIPEIGEEVIVGFEGGNAEKPYVLGSLYNGKQAAAGIGTEKNSRKMIRSRSGHTLELDDTDGAEKLRMYDREGNVIEFDPQAKTLTIQAVGDLNLVGKSISLQAEEGVAIQAGKDVTMTTDGKAIVEAKGEVALLSDADIKLEATAEASLAGKSVVVAGDTSAEVKATSTKIQGTTTTIQGATGKTDYT